MAKKKKPAPKKATRPAKKAAAKKPAAKKPAKPAHKKAVLKKKSYQLKLTLPATRRQLNQLFQLVMCPYCQYCYDASHEKLFFNSS